MDATPLPAGFTGRPADPERDAEAVAGLINGISQAVYGIDEASVTRIVESWRFPGFDPARETLLAHGTDGRLAAAAESWDVEEPHVAPWVDLRVRVDLLPPDRVDPESDGARLADALLAWGEMQARGAVARAPEDARVAVHGEAESVHLGMRAALESRGWEVERRSWQMEIELDDEPPPPPEWPAGITVRSARRDVDEPTIHAAEQEFFADHYGHLVLPYPEWFHLSTRLLPYQPELWFLAMDGEQVAGMALCLPDRHGNPQLGWVRSLAVGRSWRRRGLGLALLRHAFRELHARGRRRVGLGVDAQSLTGATRLYERAGMRVVREHLEYEKLLRPGRELRTVSLGEPESVG